MGATILIKKLSCAFDPYKGRGYLDALVCKLRFVPSPTMGEVFMEAFS